jgi:hypothetical protein
MGASKDKEEAALERLAKRILATPHKPREDSKIGKSKKTELRPASGKTRKKLKS